MKQSPKVTKLESQVLAVSALVLTAAFIYGSEEYDWFSYMYFIALTLAAATLKFKFKYNYKKLSNLIVNFIAYSVVFYLLIMLIFIFTTEWGPN